MTVYEMPGPDIPNHEKPDHEKPDRELTVYETLHAQCAALGRRLFTITTLDLTAGLARRAYSSHPVEYPVSGTKPLTRDGWHEFCITGQQTFVANTTPEFARYFFDHALIAAQHDALVAEMARG